MAQAPADSSDSGSSNGSISRSLLERLKHKDSAAWHELVHLYAPLVIYWCQKQGLKHHEREDVMQDVFRTVVCNISRFRKERPTDTFRGWLRTITRSRVVDHFRRTASEPDPSGGTEAQLRINQFAEPVLESELDDHRDEAVAEQALFQRAIEMIRTSFEDKTWQAFWRVVVDGRSTQEVADELGMRPGTVRVAKSRVLNRLRAQLGDQPN